jgi:hypothetical protein
MPTNLLNRPCDIVRRGPSGTEDDYGNLLPDESISSTVCEFQQDSRREHGDNNDMAESKWRIFLPVGTDITSGDQVIVDGKAYEVDGEPEAVRNPRTRTMSHVEATVVRTAGSFEVAS